MGGGIATPGNSTISIYATLLHHYIATNFVGGILLTYTYSRFEESLGPGVNSAIIASLVMWSTTRIYGGGHVVMPLWIFAIMSTGLAMGNIGAGQFLRIIHSRQ